MDGGGTKQEEIRKRLDRIGLSRGNFQVLTILKCWTAARQDGWPGGSRRAVIVVRARVRFSLKALFMAAARQDGHLAKMSTAWSIKTELNKHGTMEPGEFRIADSRTVAGLAQNDRGTYSLGGTCMF
jgi:hypothetical protein